jgi:hypothetical protein
MPNIQKWMTCQAEPRPSTALEYVRPIQAPKNPTGSLYAPHGDEFSYKPVNLTTRQPTAKMSVTFTLPQAYAAVASVGLSTSFLAGVSTI